MYDTHPTNMPTDCYQFCFCSVVLVGFTCILQGYFTFLGTCDWSRVIEAILKCMAKSHTSTHNWIYNHKKKQSTKTMCIIMEHSVHSRSNLSNKQNVLFFRSMCDLVLALSSCHCLMEHGYEYDFVIQLNMSVYMLIFSGNVNKMHNCYKAVDFLPSPHNMHPIAQLVLMYILPQLLQCCMQYYGII